MPESDVDVKLERINLLITKKCNLWCRMCDYRLFREDSRELTFPQIQTLINDARDLGVKRLEITGGEPMIRREVYDIIACACAAGMVVAMMTNGTLIGAMEAKQLIDAGLSVVVISLEGFEELNDSLRGPGSFQKAVNAIRYLRQYEDQLSHIGVGVVVSKYNYQQLYDFTRFLFEDIGINAISFNPFTKDMLHHSKHNNLDDFIMDEVRIVELEAELDKITAYARVTSGQFQDEHYFRRMLDYFRGKSMAPRAGCRQPLQSCGIDVSGQVYPCWIEYVAAGDLNRSPLKEIINSKDYQAVCRRAMMKACKGCLSACYYEAHLEV